MPSFCPNRALKVETIKKTLKASFYKQDIHIKPTIKSKQEEGLLRICQMKQKSVSPLVKTMIVEDKKRIMILAAPARGPFFGLPSE